MFVCSVPYLHPPYSPTSRHLLPGFWLFWLTMNHRYFLVNRMKANVQKQLLEELFNEYSFERLLGESEESIGIRTRAIESLELLEQALVVMDDVKRDVA